MTAHTTPSATLPPRESAAGAWWGLYLVLWGCASGLWAGTVASAAVSADAALELGVAALDKQRAEGVLGPGLSELVAEITAQVESIRGPLLLDATIDGVLALLLVFAGFGICFRSRTALLVGRGAVGLKLVAVAVSLYVLWSTVGPRLDALWPLLEEFVERTNSGARGRMDVSALEEVVAASLWTQGIASSLAAGLGLLAAVLPSVARWCAARAPESGVASNGPRG